MDIGQRRSGCPGNDARAFSVLLLGGDWGCLVRLEANRVHRARPCAIIQAVPIGDYRRVWCPPPVVPGRWAAVTAHSPERDSKRRFGHGSAGRFDLSYLSVRGPRDILLLLRPPLSRVRGPCAYDGPCGMSANCADPNNCTGCVQVGRYSAAGKVGPAKKTHFVDEKLVQNGIQPPLQTVFSQGATVIEPLPNVRINYVRCHKNPWGAGEGTVFARVFWVKIKPPINVVPCPEWEDGLGCQVKVPQNVDRDCLNGDVVTLARHGHAMTILVRLRDNRWGQYAVVLLQGHGET